MAAQTFPLLQQQAIRPRGDFAVAEGGAPVLHDSMGGNNPGHLMHSPGAVGKAAGQHHVAPAFRIQRHARLRCCP
ncbi:hypothetical protein D3C81_2167590 [compost metagenome]